MISAVTIFLIAWYYTGTAKVTGALAAGTICIMIGSMGLWFSKHEPTHGALFVFSVVVLVLGGSITALALARGRAAEDIAFSAAVAVAILSAFFGMVLLAT